MTLNTPREKVDDLEEMKLDTANRLDSNRKLTKSVTFDIEAIKKRSPHKFGQNDKTDSDKDSSSSEEEKRVRGLKEEMFDDANIVEIKQKSILRQIFNHCINSSLFIFHRDWKIRRYLIALVVSPETQLEYENKRKEEVAYETFKNEELLKNQQSAVSVVSIFF